MKTDTHVRKLPYVDVIPFGLSNVCRALNNAMRLLHRVASRPAYICPKAPAEDAIRLQCLDKACIAYVISFIITSKMHEVNNPKYSIKSSVKMRKQ